MHGLERVVVGSASPSAFRLPCSFFRFNFRGRVAEQLESDFVLLRSGFPVLARPGMAAGFTFPIYTPLYLLATAFRTLFLASQSRPLSIVGEWGRLFDQRWV